MYTHTPSSLFLSLFGKIHILLLWCNACLTIVWYLSLSRKGNSSLFAEKLIRLWFLRERFQCASSRGTGDAVKRWAGLVPAESLGWREGCRERRQKNSVVWEGLVSTDSVTNHTPCDLTGLLQGAAVLAWQRFWVGGKWDFSSLWVPPGSFPEERSWNRTLNCCWPFSQSPSLTVGSSGKP